MNTMVWLKLHVIVLLSTQYASIVGSVGSSKYNPNTDTIGREALDQLANNCYDNLDTPLWWGYVWCNEKYVKQVHFDHQTKKIAISNNIGYYSKEESGYDHQVFRSKFADCKGGDDNDPLVHRYSEVTLHCCEQVVPNKRRLQHSNNNLNTFVESVTEPVPCTYYIKVCSDAICLIDKNTKKDVKTNGESTAKHTNGKAVPHSGRAQQTVYHHTNNIHLKRNNKAYTSSSTTEVRKMTREEKYRLSHSKYKNITFDYNNNTSMQSHMLDRVRSMFYHGYDSYMTHAFPDSELKPISCRGGTFDLIKLPLVTLIDAMDTLVILGNYSEFRRTITLVSSHYKSFDVNVNVSVFETTIRILGGLLSSHLFAIDPKLGIFPYYDDANQLIHYDDSMLSLAKDIADRLMPAFKTKTGIPYGTVNLMYGVPKGETEVASTAGAGSLIVEFEALSSLLGDPKYGEAAYASSKALFDRKSSIGLLGKHINIKTGKWIEIASGIGSNSDSFYEYLLKAYLLFRNDEYFDMFVQAYTAIKRFVQVDEWFADVDMFNGKVRKNRVENLQAFWPGIEAMLGLSESSARLLNSFYMVWNDLGFLPEEFDFVQWQNGKGVINSLYPLRPELIESTYHHYRATKDRSWLIAGTIFLDSIEANAKTECGYSAVSHAATDEVTDTMPSFFLSETCKYLYLLFDDNNFVHDRAYIFSTEAHLFDPLQLPAVARSYINTSASIQVKRVNVSDSEGLSMQEALDKIEKIYREQKDEISVVYDHKADAIHRGCISSNDADGEDNSMKSSSDTCRDVLDELKAFYAREALKFDEMFASKRARIEQTYRDNAALAAAVEADVDHSKRDIDSNVDREEVDHIVRRVPLFPVEIFDFKCPRKVWWDQNQAYNFLPSMHTGKLRNGVDDNTSKVFDVLKRVTSKTSFDIYKATAANRIKRIDTCYIDDYIVNGSDNSADAVSSHHLIDVAIAQLGDFSVQVFPDGFIVHSKVYGDTLEISNIGQSTIFARDTNAGSSKTIIGNIIGNTLTCTVSIIVYDKQGKSYDTVWQRSCSVSTFGPNDVKPIIADIVIPQSEEDATLCQSSSSGGSVDSSVQQSNRWWWPWISSASKSYGFGSSKKPFDGKFVLAARGGCLFEEKNSAAEAAGAAGLIIANKENYLFIMSGKEQTTTSGANTATTSTAATATRIAGKIPTVMLTRDDAESLSTLMLDNVGNGNVKVRLEIDCIPTVLDNEFVGNDAYPKLRMDKSIVHLVGRGKWGMTMASVNGHEWQLYILSKDELHNMQLVTYGAMHKESKEQVTISAALTMNPVEMYASLLKRKCSSKMSYDGNSIVLH